ncbi:transposable element Tcb1 transposase [Trichonephila clavipes]|nr:transposable element Tcb1 transposase [Trichonephila clavipes]
MENISPRAFDQVSEFDRGRIVANRDRGLSFREISSRVGQDQKTVRRLCNCWMQEGTTDRRGRSHPPQCTTSLENRQIVRMSETDRSVTSRTVGQRIESVKHHSVSPSTIRRRLQLSVQSARCPSLGLPLTQNHISLLLQWVNIKTAIVSRGPASSHQYFKLSALHLRGAGAICLSLASGLSHSYIFQQDNARPHVTRIVQRFFVNHRIELLPWPVHSPDPSPVENV